MRRLHFGVDFTSEPEAPKPVLFCKKSLNEYNSDSTRKEERVLIQF